MLDSAASVGDTKGIPMELEIKLPVRDRDEVITAKTITEVPLLLDDADERAMCRELLTFVAHDVSPGHPVRVGMVEEILDSYSAAERRDVFDVLRKRAKLKRVSQLEAEHAHREAMKAPRKMGTWGYSPSGAIIDLHEADTDAAKERARAESLAARRESERQDAEVNLAHARALEAEQTEQLRSQTPPGVLAP